jgi:hypothetical protein
MIDKLKYKLLNYFLNKINNYQNMKDTQKILKYILLYYLSKQLKNQKNNKFKENKSFNLKKINLKNITSNYSGLKKTYLITNIKKKKVNYFNSKEKRKQNKELIIIETISDNLKKTISSILPYINKKLLNSKITSYYKLLNVLSRSFKEYIKILVLDLKLNGLKTKIFSGKKTKNLEMKIEQYNSHLVKHSQEKKINFLNYIYKEQEENNKESDLIKLKNEKKKDETITSNNINILTAPSPIKLKTKIFYQNTEQKDQFNNSNLKNKTFLVKKENIIGRVGLGFLDETKNRRKYNFLLFLHNLEKKIKSTKIFKNNINNNAFILKVTKDNKLNFYKTNKIRKYINSKTTFNSKIANLLSTSNNYNFKRYKQINNSIKNNIYEFLHRSFISMFSLISKPVFVTKPDKIIIQLFFLLLKKKTGNLKNNKSKFILKKKYNK